MGTEFTRREAQIVKYFAWGASVKEVADALKIKYKTVDNHKTNIYRKTGCGKLNELAAWWFCKTYNIPIEDAPAMRSQLFKVAMATVFLALYINLEIYSTNDCCRFRGRRITRIEFVRSRVRAKY